MKSNELTDRQREILQAAAEGTTSIKGLADRFGVREMTIKGHLYNFKDGSAASDGIYARLEVGSLIEAIMEGWRMGEIEIPGVIREEKMEILKIGKEANGR